ncbi:MAG: protein kinase [Planctomycetes bacterium]|nr:protein kinase [Planctomycetota bacterium]
MGTHILLDAVDHAIAAHGLIEADGRAALLARARAAAPSSVDDFAAWLRAQQGVSPRLVERLLQLLPLHGVDRFGPFRLLAHLADGGIGSVWLATDDDQRLVVVKHLQARGGRHPEYRQRFEREARLMASIDHPHIARGIASGIHDGAPFLALEYVRGRDVQHIINDSVFLDEGATLRIVMQVVDGLGEIHRHGLVHRDLKPGNVILTDSGIAKLVDFGIARSTSDARTFFTAEGNSVGSPAFMSPEQIAGRKDLDIRSDIYAIGALLYTCLAGCPPFAGSVPEVVKAHRTAAIPDIRRARPDVSQATAAVIGRCLAKHPQERFADPAALAAALAEAHLQLLAPAHPHPHLAAAPETVAIGRAADSTALVRMAAAGSCASAATARMPSRPDPRSCTTGVCAAAAGGAILRRITLETAGGRMRTCLFGGTSLILGKLRRKPVDVCLRNYPVPEHAERCSAIGRMHLRIDIDTLGCVVTDLGSANGTRIDGERMLGARPLERDRRYRLDIADVVTLSVRCYGSPRDGGGYETDCVVITRIGNHPDLAYALVAKRITLGGPGSQAPIGSGSDAGDLRFSESGWGWNPAGAGSGSMPATVGTELVCGASYLRIAPGRFSDFD